MNNIDVIDLFCGCGGFSEGAKQAGARVILAVDIWEEALRIHRQNHSDTEHWNRDVGEDGFASSIKDFIMQHRTQNRDKSNARNIHIHASPPCQDFSQMGIKQDISRGIHLYDCTVAMCMEMWSSGIVSSYSIENVHSKTLVSKHGCTTYNFSKFGVPQTRRRSLILKNVNLDDVTVPIPSVREIIQHYYPHIDLDRQRLRACVRKTTFLDRNTIVFKGLSCSRDINGPCYTITCNPQRLIDVDDFSVTYMNNIGVNAEIQTFPRDYNWAGVTKANVFSMIGNAVPPSVSKIIICNIH